MHKKIKFNIVQRPTTSVYEDLAIKYQKAQSNASHPFNIALILDFLFRIILICALLYGAYYVYTYKARIYMRLTVLPISDADNTWKQNSLGTFLYYKIHPNYTLKTYTNEGGSTKAIFNKYQNPTYSSIELFCTFSYDAAKEKEIEDLKKDNRFLITPIKVGNRDANLITPAGFGSKRPAFEVVQIVNKTYCRYVLNTKNEAAYKEDSAAFGKLISSIRLK